MGRGSADTSVLYRRDEIDEEIALGGAAATWMMRFRFEKETPHDGKTAQTLAGG